MSEKWYIIPDLEQFTDKTRAVVYNNFGLWQSKDALDVLIDDITEQDQEEFNKVLSHQESLVIIKELIKTQKNRKTKETRYTINDSIFADIIYKLNDRMVSNVVNSLVQKGLIESAFDNETNDFIFWIKDDKEEEKPETD